MSMQRHNPNYIIKLGFKFISKKITDLSFKFIANSLI